MKVLYRTVISLFFLFSASLYAQEATIFIDLGIKKYIGQENKLDRSKYFGIQSSFDTNELEEEAPYLFGELRVRPALDFNGPQPFGNLEDLSTSNITSTGTSVYKARILNSVYKTYKSDSFLLTQDPLKVFKLNTEADKAAEKIAAYLKSAYSLMPKYYDLMNEPFAKASAFDTNTTMVRTQMSNYYATVATELKKEFPSLKVGGHSAARPRFELNDFKNWEENEKVFMDTAGEQLDFFSMHLYDEVDVDTGTIKYCSGSNVEAILDLIETYSHSKWKVVKPHLISSYGLRIPQWEGAKYNAEHDSFTIESLNHMLMTFMDKADRIEKAIPYIVGRAEDFYKDTNKNPNGNVFPWAISRKLEDGTYAYTDLIKFYEFWRDVEGERTYVSSNNPDILVNAFVNKGRWYMIFNNLADEAQVLNLNFTNIDIERITKYTLRRIYTNEAGLPDLTEAFTDIHIDQLDIDPHETFMLICDVPEDAGFSTSIVEYNNYSNQFLTPIEANKPMTFNFENVITGKGKANIRLGIGRKSGLELNPIVKINGEIVLTPKNWAGYDQSNRKSFFGVLTIPIPMSYLKETNTVEVMFFDTGGKVSSVVLNTELFSKDIENKNYADVNKPVYVSHGGNLLHVANTIECKSPKILSLNGNLVKKLKFYNNGETIDISTLDSGEYYLETSTDGKFKFKK